MDLIVHLHRKAQKAAKLKVSLIFYLICLLAKIWFTNFQFYVFPSFRILGSTKSIMRDGALIRFWTSYTPRYKDALTMVNEQRMSHFGIKAFYFSPGIRSTVREMTFGATWK